MLYVFSTASNTPLPQETTPQMDQETSPNPPPTASVQLSIVISVVFTISSVAVLLVGLFQCQRHRGTENTFPFGLLNG